MQDFPKLIEKGARDMRKIRIYDNDGKTRDERETCFPATAQMDKNKGAGLQ